jgi:hypothetical protein
MPALSIDAIALLLPRSFAPVAQPPPDLTTGASAILPGTRRAANSRHDASTGIRTVVTGLPLGSGMRANEPPDRLGISHRLGINRGK